MLDDGRCSRSEEASSNPVGTIEDIRRRLIRPSPTPITTTSIIASHEPHALEAKRRKLNTTKLEDYLDPVLLSAIRSQLKNKTHQKKKDNFNRNDFKWPSDELITSFPVDMDSDSSKKWSDGAVNLIHDRDIFRTEEHDHTDEQEQVAGSSHFGRFEMSVSKFSHN